MTARSSIHVVNRDLQLLDLDEPLTFPIELVSRAPPRATVHAVVATAAPSATSRDGPLRLDVPPARPAGRWVGPIVTCHGHSPAGTTRHPPAVHRV